MYLIPTWVLITFKRFRGIIYKTVIYYMLNTMIYDLYVLKYSKKYSASEYDFNKVWCSKKNWFCYDFKL